MPEVKITIGTRQFDVACQEGEEHYLESAAKMLDGEASVLVEQIGRMPESRMLLMSGLMLADRTAGLEDKLKAAEAALGEARAKIEALEEEGPSLSAVPEDLSPVLEVAVTRAEEIAGKLEAAS